MARDETPYEDDHGTRSDPEMTGDVLSPRWTADAADTDEQPAITVDGDVAYVLPAESAAPAPDVSAPAEESLIPYVAADQDPALYPSADQEPAEETPAAPAGDEPLYLPLDQGYQAPQEPEEEPKRGFLGSGWMEEPEPDREVRRRTRVLLLGAAAVVLVGVAGGWLMSTSSTDQGCRGSQCVSAGKESQAPVPSPAPTDDALDSSTPEPSPTITRARATRTPEPATSPTRVGTATHKPTAKASEKPTREPQTDEVSAVEDEPQTQATTAEPSATQTTAAPTQASATTAAPAPTQSSSQNGGLLDLLFGWAK